VSDIFFEEDLVKKIFFNSELNSIRAGWRMAMFTLLYAASILLVGLVIKGLSYFGIESKSFILNEALGYGALLFVMIGWVKWFEKRPLRSVGLEFNKNFGRDILQGLLIGGGMMTAIFIVEYSSGFVHLSFKQMPVTVLMQLTGTSIIIFTIGAFGEEMLFRGYLFQTLAEGTNKIIAVVIFALFFAGMHLGNPNVTFFSVINIAFAGVWLSVAYFKTRSLWFATGLHFSWNFFQNHIFSFPVSGLDFKQYQLGILMQSGPDWITGGSFGPEGGALTTVMLFAATYFIYRSPWIRPVDDAWFFEQWIEQRKLEYNNQIVP